MIRLIALDLDNTLLMKDNTIPQEVCDALAEAASRGIEVVPVTGRLFPSASSFSRMVGSSSPIICYNGGIVETLDRKVLKAWSVPSGVQKAMARYCAEKKLYLQLYDPEHGDAICVAAISPRIMASQYSEAGVEYREYGDLTKADVRSPKMMISADAAYLAQLRPELDQLFGDALDFTYSDDWIMEVLPKGSSKESTLAWYCAYRGIRQDEVMACGDNLNDLGMIRWAGVGVSVANGVPAVRKAADYVTKEERSFGVLEAVRRFVLN